MNERRIQLRDELMNDVSRSIDEEAAKEFPFRHHLGASLLGHPCQLYLFFTFRWVQEQDVSTRVRRIFKRGHREEDYMIDLLRQAGHTVFTIDPVTGEQYRAPNLPPHIGGSMDGLLVLPESYRDDFGDYIPIECKTHNQRSATKTFKDNLREAYPQHWTQANIYATSVGSKYFAYVGINKNTDELYIEICEVVPFVADFVVKRAVTVVYTHAAKALEKTAEKWRCNMCEFKTLCKKKLPAQSRNCRSCQHALPVENGTWLCTRLNESIEKYTEIERARQCPHWTSIL